MKKWIIFIVCLLIGTVQAEGWSIFSALLKPSSVNGVGVFVAHDVKAGEKVFTGEFTTKKAKMSDIPALFKSYVVPIDDEYCWRPDHFSHMEVFWYLNHSQAPNVKSVGLGQLVAVRDIKAGEELLICFPNFGAPVKFEAPSKKQEFGEFSLIVQPSKVCSGLGVFATHDMSAGTKLVNPRFFKKLTININDIPQEFRKYCDSIKGEEAIIPERLDCLLVYYFLNHSMTPNLEHDEEKRCWSTTREIKAGEELLINYETTFEEDAIEEFHPSIVSSN